MPVVDVGQLRRLGDETLSSSELLGTQHSIYADHVRELQLTGTALATLCENVVTELRVFSEVAQLKADDIEAVANGGSPSNSDTIASKLDILEARLNDDVGSNGMDDSEGNDLSPKGLEKWKKAHPDLNPGELQEKMDQAAAAGNAAAMEYLSNLLWQKLAGLSDDAATDYLFKLGPAAFTVAVESTGAPATLPVSRYLAAMAGGHTVPPYGSQSALAAYLRDRHGINNFDSTNSINWAANQLEKMASMGNTPEGSIGAKTALEGIDWWDQNGGDGKRSPELAEVARRIALFHPDALGNIVDTDAAWAQRLTDLMAAGSDGPDGKRIKGMLLNIQAALLIYCESINEENKKFNQQNDDPSKEKNPEAGSVTYARYYRLMQAIGHSFSFKGEAAIAALVKIFKQVAGKDPRAAVLGNLASILVDLGGIVEEDELPSKRNEEADIYTDQRNVALMILMQRNPEKADAILRRLKKALNDNKDPDDPDYPNLELGELTKDIWNKLPTTPEAGSAYAAAMDLFGPLLDEIKAAWQPGQK